MYVGRYMSINNSTKKKKSTISTPNIKLLSRYANIVDSIIESRVDPLLHHSASLYRQRTPMSTMTSNDLFIFR